MRSLKLGGALAAAVALVALAAAASAPATVLCKVASSSSCGASNQYGTGTEIKMVNTTGSRVVIEKTTSEHINECEADTINGKTTNAGGPGLPVLASLETLSFSSCVVTNPVVLKSGSIEFLWINGTNNAQVKIKNVEITVTAPVDCIYGVGVPVELGKTEGSRFTLHMTLPRVGENLSCPSQMQWTGIYTISAPNPFFVTGS